MAEQRRSRQCLVDTADHIFDRPPTYANVAGFLNGLDPAFVAYPGRDRPHYDQQHGHRRRQALQKRRSYVTRDKIYLPSRTKYTAPTKTRWLPEGEQYPTDVGTLWTPDKIKYDLGFAVLPVSGGCVHPRAYATTRVRAHPERCTAARDTVTARPRLV